MKQIKTKDIIKVLEDKKEVSAWNKGVRKYVVAVLRYLKENTIDGLLKVNHYEFLRKKVLYND